MLFPRRFFTTLLLACGLASVGWSREVVWRLDPQRSVIEIAVHSTFNDFVCRVPMFDAEIVLEPPNEVSRASVSFDLAVVTSGRPQRDSQLRTWAEIERFPQARFVLSRLTPASSGGWRAQGVITLHGVEKNITFPVRMLIQGPLYSVDGEAIVDHRDFGLPVLRRFYVVTVDPHLAVTFHLQGRLSEASSGE